MSTQIIEGRERDLGGGMMVKRVLPFAKKRTVGPFIFFDQMGPAKYSSGHGMDVRPHPHIGLATVTYLFEGAIMHRDSIGSEQLIEPGAVNWMVAGRGIVHSERTPEHLRNSGGSLYGIQCWIALPKEHEETAPQFAHHPANTIPDFKIGNASARLILGNAFGKKSPAIVFSDICYLEILIPQGEKINFPTEERELGSYLVNGDISVGEQKLEVGSLFVSSPHENVHIEAHSDSRIMLLGGKPLNEERFIFWNFVSSSEERLEKAKKDWSEQRFPKIPGDDKEFIPLPSPGK